jgi:hypothetical protein
VVRDGAHAILHIQDGGQESDRNLAPSEFRTGSITYEPKSSEVTFRLDLYSGEPHAIGLVQVMFPPSPVPRAPAAEAIATVSSNKVIASSEAPPTPRVDSNLSSAPHIDSKAPPPQIHIANYENRQIPPPAVEAARESEIVTAQTPASTPVTVNFDKPPRPPSIAALPEVSAADQRPSVRVSTEPVEGTRFGHLVGKIPILRRLKKPVKVAAPVPVYQAKPTIKMPDTAKLTRPVTIGVKVNVGESGAVDRAEVVEYGDPPNFTLANAALAAARQWTFEMPRIEDGAISNELILHFYFSP